MYFSGGRLTVARPPKTHINRAFDCHSAHNVTTDESVTLRANGRMTGRPWTTLASWPTHRATNIYCGAAELLHDGKAASAREVVNGRVRLKILPSRRR